jgi:hypothetical protein
VNGWKRQRHRPQCLEARFKIVRLRLRPRHQDAFALQGHGYRIFLGMMDVAVHKGEFPAALRLT